MTTSSIGAHIAIRTIRKFMDRYGENMSVIFVVRNSIDLAAYEALLKLYFPRNNEEVEMARTMLPKV